MEIVPFLLEGFEVSALLKKPSSPTIKDDTNINMKETQYNENVYLQNQTSDFTKKEVLTDVKNKKAFDLKRAVVYSSILERPYK